MSSPSPSMQRRPTLKWVCHSTPLYIATLKFIHAMRNMFWTKETDAFHVTIMCFELWKMSNSEKSTHLRAPRLKGIIITKKFNYSFLIPGADCFVYCPKAAFTRQTKVGKLKLVCVNGIKTVGKHVSIWPQQFANVSAACSFAFHTHQLGFANTSLPTYVCRVKAA